MLCIFFKLFWRGRIKLLLLFKKINIEMPSCCDIFFLCTDVRSYYFILRYWYSNCNYNTCFLINLILLPSDCSLANCDSHPAAPLLSVEMLGNSRWSESISFGRFGILLKQLCFLFITHFGADIRNKDDVDVSKSGNNNTGYNMAAASSQMRNANTDRKESPRFPAIPGT